jgi:hypothetical protein
MFGLGKAGQIVKIDAQADFRVEFVDVLAAGTPGSRKIDPGRGVNRIMQEKGIHALLIAQYWPPVEGRLYKTAFFA